MESGTGVGTECELSAQGLSGAGISELRKSFLPVGKPVFLVFDIASLPL